MVCSCGRKIPKARLKAVPGATSCVTCQGEDELALAVEEERSRRSYDRKVSETLLELHGACALAEEAEEPSDDEETDPEEYASLTQIDEAWFEGVVEEEIMI